jgi:ribosomal protein S18 acetylase RimI-like enzyme
MLPMGSPPPWTFTAEPFDSPDAVALWAAYYTEVSDRWYLLNHRRRTDPAELEREIAAVSWSELTPPTGQLIVARYDGEAAGCGGVRMIKGAEGAERLDVRTGELKRVYLRPEARGRGGARRLLAAIEEAARALGAERLVLDTREDLVEARALYARCGYTEIPPYSDNLYAERFFQKLLAPRRAG